MLARHARATARVLGFTDHDRDLAFDATTFAAATGFTATEIKDAVGLSVDNLEVESALRSDSLNEDDLAAGLFDDAAIEIWRVNWQDTAQRVLMRSGSIGEVRRSGPAFAAEVRGLAHYLQQPKGRLFQYGCDADLGDVRCTVDLTDPAFKGTGTVIVAASLRRFTVLGLDAFLGDWFTRGLLTFTSGANAGRSQEVRRFLFAAPPVVELWQPIRPRHRCPATPSPSPPAATSSSPPARPSSPTPSTSAASRTSPATTSSPPSPAPATPPTTAGLAWGECEVAREVG